ncbi:hypothetical protein [Aeromicrobium sp. Root495]|uniref:hypothetical protein n=1 Tax=Aeromicrobium sp. Root495 TaxID=1736550 RepID=UPI000A92632E|nr:hypothetical protein [Aeromicrobium sp. Root495]
MDAHGSTTETGRRGPRSPQVRSRVEASATPLDPDRLRSRTLAKARAAGLLHARAA